MTTRRLFLSAILAAPLAAKLCPSLVAAVEPAWCEPMKSLMDTLVEFLPVSEIDFALAGEVDAFLRQVRDDVAAATGLSPNLVSLGDEARASVAGFLRA